jgi:hypothetical protein
MMIDMVENTTVEASIRQLRKPSEMPPAPPIASGYIEYFEGAS